MAKTKHQKLAKLMQQILLGIEEHASKVAQQLNLIQMHFYEKKYIFERPLMPQKTLEKMMQSHFLGLQHFSPNPDLREKVLKNGMIGFILPEPAPSKSKIIHRQTVGWFIPWGVRVLSPRDNQAWLDQRKLVAILYCPRTSELSKVIDWYEIEDASDSLTYQILTMAEYERQMAIIQGNLLKDPFPLWKQAKKEWQAPPSEDSDPDWVYEVAKKPRDLDGLDFAPQEGQSLASAYEAVIESIREKKT
jgi:hypothetical protein